MTTRAEVERHLIASLPTATWGSTLYRMGGVGVVDGTPGRAALAALQAEAIRLRCHASPIDQSGWDGEQIRGGDPPRQYLCAPGGPVQDAFYHSPEIRCTLCQLVAGVVEPSGVRGSYSYYCRAGDHLGLHRDVVGCELAVVSLLWSFGGGGARLQVYPDRLFDPLGSIASNPVRGRWSVDLHAGQSVVILGGLVPHLVSPTAAGESRAVSVLCYCIH